MTMEVKDVPPLRAVRRATGVLAVGATKSRYETLWLTQEYESQRIMAAYGTKCLNAKMSRFSWRGLLAASMLLNEP